MRKKCKITREYLKEQLEKLGFGVPEVHGGYFIWAKLSSPFQDGYDFAVQLFNQTKVAVVPGENSSSTQTQYIRLNFPVGIDILKQAVKRMKTFFSDSST